MTRDELAPDATEAQREEFRRSRQAHWHEPSPPEQVHDPLCKEHTEGGAYYCICDVLARARADERKRIADGLWPLIEPITSWIAGATPDQLRGAELVRDAVLSNLRDKVEALPNEWNDFVRRADVLALIAGATR